MKRQLSSRQLVCTLTPEALLDLYHKQGGCCAITGHTFAPLADSGSTSTRTMDPWTLSLDRKDSKGDYTIDNVQWTCYAYNVAKNKWTHEEVMSMYRVMLRGGNPPFDALGTTTSVNKVVRTLRLNSKHSTPFRGRPFDLDQRYLLDLFTAQEGKCSRTAIPLSLVHTKGVPNPWRASLDRIDNNQSYVKGNVQFVVQMYNFAKNTWTDEVVREVGRLALEQEEQRSLCSPHAVQNILAPR